jgi:hypothetical protein
MYRDIVASSPEVVKLGSLDMEKSEPLLAVAGEATKPFISSIVVNESPSCDVKDYGSALRKIAVNLVGYLGAAIAYDILYIVLASPSTSSTSEDINSQWHMRALLIAWNCHFIKRALECIFVHKWRDSHVPFLDSIGNPPPARDPLLPQSLNP